MIVALNSFTYCCDDVDLLMFLLLHTCRLNRHSVWKSPKMSHLNFSILAFTTNFCPIKIDMSGNTVWQQASSFQKNRQIVPFLAFLINFFHSKCKLVSLAILNATFCAIFNHCDGAEIKLVNFPHFWKFQKVTFWYYLCFSFLSKIKMSKIDLDCNRFFSTLAPL